MWRNLRWLSLALLPFIAGCIPWVYSEQPLGEAVAALKPEEWNGVWLDEQGNLVRFLVTDFEGGELLMTEQGICEGQRREGTDDTAVRMRQTDGWYFPHFAVRDRGHYDVVGVFRRDNEALVFCPVRISRVKELVTEGALPGHLEKEDVVLGLLTNQHYKILLATERPVFACDPGESHVSVRLPAALDPCGKVAPVK